MSTAAPPLTAGEAPTGGRGASLGAQLALVAVTAGAVLGWTRLFTGTNWIGPLLAVAVVGHAMAAGARRARLGVTASAGASLVVSALVFCWTTVADTTVGGIPGVATFHELARQVSAAQAAFHSVQAPTTALTGYLVILGALVWIVTVASDWLAFRLRARAESLVPAGGLFLIGTVLGGTPRRDLAVLAFAVPVLAFVLVHRTARESRPANRIAVGDGGRRRLLGAGTVLAGVAVLVGTVAAGALPGANRHTLLNWRTQSSNNPRVTLSPLVDIRSHLTSGADALLFVVRADKPAYWRLSTLDQFDGEVWGSSGTYGDTSSDLPGTGNPYGGHWSRLAQSYSITALAQVWAPAAALPASVLDASVPLRWDSSSQTLIVAADGATTDGASYQVVSKVPALTPALLRRASGPAPKEIRKHDTALPDDFPASIRRLAQRVIAGAATPYDEAMKLEAYFRDNPHFRYSTNPTFGESDNGMVAFLQSGEGFCEQFAGTYAAMARSIGLPTRLAVGFTPGVPDPQHPDQFVVRGRQYHAWPEVYFSGIGWVPFEPTPGRGSPSEQSYTGITPQQDTGTGTPQTISPPATTAGGSGTATTAPPASTPAAPTTTPTRRAPVLPPPPASGSSHHGGDTVLWWVLGGLLLFVVVLLVAFGAPLGLALRRRRRRAAAAGAPAAAVAAAWLDACEALSLVAPPPQPAETHLELARRAALVVPAAGGALTELAQLATRTAWATPPVDAGRMARDLAGTIEARVHAALGRWGVLRRSVGWQLLRADRRVRDAGHSSRWKRSRMRSVVLSR